MATILLFFTSPTQGPPNQMVQRVKWGHPVQGQVPREKDGGITVALQPHLIVQDRKYNLVLMFRGLNLSYLSR